jgi:hypothetical protein
MLRFYSLILFSLLSVAVAAQTPDSLLEPSPVKTLTLQQYTALMKGEDLYNMIMVADINKYPDPANALKYKKELNLSAAQITALAKIDKELTRKKIEMGGFIVTNETKLDNLFRTKKINESDLIFYTNRYGLYMGELRNAILAATLNTNKLLSPQQINKLIALKNHN